MSMENTKTIKKNHYKPDDETIEQRLVRIHNKFIDYRGGIGGNGLTESGHEVLFHLRYCLTGKAESSSKITKL